MYLWIVFGITLASHIGLIIIFEKQRKKIGQLRDMLAKQRKVAHALNHRLHVKERQR